MARLEVDRGGALLPDLPAGAYPHDPFRGAPPPPEADGVLRRDKDASVPSRHGLVQRERRLRVALEEHGPRARREDGLQERDGWRGLPHHVVQTPEEGELRLREGLRVRGRDRGGSPPRREVVHAM